MKKTRRVALFIEDNRGFGRSLLRGISHYSKIHGPWTFYREAPFYENSLTAAERFSRLIDWQPNGIILREQGELDGKIRSLGIPFIYSAHKKGPLPDVCNILGGDREIGFTGAEHFLERGFKTFAYCGFDEMWWSRERGRFFAERLSAEGYPVSFYNSLPENRKWESEPDKISGWLHKLSHPCAVMSCTDDRARQVLDACFQAGLKVPEEIAVLGVDNDELVCELSSPPLSSIPIHGEKAGFEAAEILDRSIEQKTMIPANITISCSNPVVRQSTDSFAIDDPVVVKALRMIRRYCRTEIRVPQIADHCGVSRRVLEIRFRKSLKRSVYQEIQHMRINAACELLKLKELSVAEIAERIGYKEIKYFSRAFKNIKGIPPSSFRKTL